ncbi:protein moonraker [Diretmus argenteus]
MSSYKPQLLFNEVVPASACNRPTRVGPPAPIVIEKLMPRTSNDKQENMGSTRSSISFTALSEERLLAAVRLAKRDLRRRRHESTELNKSLVKPPQEDPPLDSSNVDLLQTAATIKIKSKASSPSKKVTRPGAKLLVHSPQKRSICPSPEDGQSPPTRDPGPMQLARGQRLQLNQEIRKLQNELATYIQKIEKLANRGQKMEEPLEPDEQHRMEIRRQKQAARSARIIYVLQQQVKEIQEDIEKLQYQKNWDTKKSRVMDRLAAAHRGAVRAMQVFIHQFSDPSEGKVPSHYKQLGQLIRQLSLCSAKVEVDQGSAVPETALDILQKLEALDSALSKQERHQKKQAQACSSSPQHRKSPDRCLSPPCAPRGPTTSGLRGPRKAAGPKRNIRVYNLICRDPSTHHGIAAQCSWALFNISEDPGRNQMQDAGFQLPTVSSRLRVTQLPQKEQSVPWIPTSPHSPPLQRSPQRSRPEPRCLFSLKPAPRQKESRGLETEQLLSSDKKKQAQNEALRQAWLDKKAMQRLKELDQLSKEEAECIQRLRSEVCSPTLSTEQRARERIQLDEDEIGESRDLNSSSLRNRLSEQVAERAAESAEQLSEALLEDLLEDAALAAWAAETDKQLEGSAQRRLQAPTLESMLLRMEEMQKDQEEVRRRFATITYSDPLYWDRQDAAGPRCHTPGSTPASPQPVRISRPVLSHSSAADIVLEKPVEAAHSILSESSLTEEGSRDEQLSGNGTVFPGPAERSSRTLISVPGGMRRNIQQYREDYEAYLRLVAHEAVGDFNPWAIADSLAEELLSEALADVAAEFQDVVEEYAEAIFTSEFLQPTQSPPSSVPPLLSQ